MPAPLTQVFVLDQLMAYQDANEIVEAINEISAIHTSDPALPTDDSWWIVRSGTTPGASVQLKVRIAGTSYVLAEITLT